MLVRAECERRRFGRRTGDESLAGEITPWGASGFDAPLALCPLLHYSNDRLITGPWQAVEITEREDHR